MHTKNYTTSYAKKETLKTIIAVIFLLAVVAAGTAWLILENRPAEPDVVYPMANQHIEWTYALKGGAGR